MYDCAGGAFHAPECDRAFMDEAVKHLASGAR